MSRPAALEMLRSSAYLQQYLPKLQRMMDSESSEDFDRSDMEVHWASFRLTACKVLDVYTVSQDDSHLTENGSRNIPNTMCVIVGTFLISAKMFLIPRVLWAISGTFSNMFLIPKWFRLRSRARTGNSPAQK
jgi:hypothetical protein